MTLAPVRLGVNIDHVATLRQVRGGTTPYPNLVHCAALAKKGGADQITIHLREDRRHIQDHDLVDLGSAKLLPLNLEMAATDEMVKIAVRERPAHVCFVPEKRKELTTEGGLNAAHIERKLKKYSSVLRDQGISVTLFIDPVLEQVAVAHRIGAAAVEFHTGSWVLAKGVSARAEWNRIRESSRFASSLGLEVHAGHGLCYETTPKIIKIPELVEVNIGHSLICYALEFGIQESIGKMKRLLTAGRGGRSGSKSGKLRG